MSADEERKDESRGEGRPGSHPKENEVVRKLPEKTDPAQERGERLATGKAIATVGDDKP